MYKDCPNEIAPLPQLVCIWQQWYMEFQFPTPVHNSNAHRPYLWLHFTILRFIVFCIWPLSQVFCICFIILLYLMPDYLNTHLGESAATQRVNRTIISPIPMYPVNPLSGNGPWYSLLYFLLCLIPDNFIRNRGKVLSFNGLIILVLPSTSIKYWIKYCFNLQSVTKELDQNTTNKFKYSLTFSLVAQFNIFLHLSVRIKDAFSSWCNNVEVFSPTLFIAI